MLESRRSPADGRIAQVAPTGRERALIRIKLTVDDLARVRMAPSPL